MSWRRSEGPSYLSPTRSESTLLADVVQVTGNLPKQISKAIETDIVSIVVHTRYDPMPQPTPLESKFANRACLPCLPAPILNHSGRAFRTYHSRRLGAITATENLDKTWAIQKYPLHTPNAHTLPTLLLQRETDRKSVV